MKQIPLVNSSKLALVDDEDFLKIRSINWGLTSNGLRICSTVYKHENKYVNLSNHIMGNYLVMYDHKDRDQLNNQKLNLRIANKSQNSANRVKYEQFKGSSSQYKGVSFDKKSQKWHAYIKVNYKKINLGYYTNEIVAARAYDRAAVEYFGEFAVTNFEVGVCQ